MMNNRATEVDGDYAADSAANQTGGGDGGTGTLRSMPFALPKVETSPSILSIVREADASAVVISWSGTGALQTAPAATGPWTPVAVEGTTFRLPTSAEPAFFRLE